MQRLRVPSASQGPRQAQPHSGLVSGDIFESRRARDQGHEPQGRRGRAQGPPIDRTGARAPGNRACDARRGSKIWSAQLPGNGDRRLGLLRRRHAASDGLVGGRGPRPGQRAPPRREGPGEPCRAAGCDAAGEPRGRPAAAIAAGVVADAQLHGGEDRRSPSRAQGAAYPCRNSTTSRRRVRSG